MNCSRPMPARLAIQLLLILLLTPIISSTRQCPVAPVNHTALGIALGASNYQGASTTGSYQTNTGIVAFTLDGAQFVGGNTTAPLGNGSSDRYYEFIASADHTVTFTATAPSNPFGGTMIGVYDDLSVRVDDGDWRARGLVQHNLQGRLHRYADKAQHSDASRGQRVQRPFGTLDKPVLAAGLKLYTIIGFGTQTLWGYDARSPTGYEYLHNMTVTFNDEEVALVPKLGDGDGTVPLWGAENDAATAKYYVKTSSSSLFGDSASHGALPNNLKVQSIVANILNSTPADPDEYLYTGGRLNQLEKMDFTIHSDANLEILDGNGGMMGWTGYNGTTLEDLPQGTFLDQDGTQYASIQNASTPYFIFVNGTQTGEFTMTVNITLAGQTTTFEYQNVTVVNGTVAQLSLDPREVGNALPARSVTTNGNSTVVFANLISRTGGQTAWPSTILFAVLAAVAITAVMAILAVERRKKRQ